MPRPGSGAALALTRQESPARGAVLANAASACRPAGSVRSRVCFNGSALYQSFSLYPLIEGASMKGKRRWLRGRRPTRSPVSAPGCRAPHGSPAPTTAMSPTSLTASPWRSAVTSHDASVQSSAACVPSKARTRHWTNYAGQRSSTPRRSNGAPPPIWPERCSTSSRRRSAHSRARSSTPGPPPGTVRSRHVRKADPPVGDRIRGSSSAPMLGHPVVGIRSPRFQPAREPQPQFVLRTLRRPLHGRSHERRSRQGRWLIRLGRWRLGCRRGSVPARSHR